MKLSICARGSIFFSLIKFQQLLIKKKKKKGGPSAMS